MKEYIKREVLSKIMNDIAKDGQKRRTKEINND